jgi:methylisocitrate lyase
MDAGTLAVPGAFNAIVAMLIEKIGFPAVYVSGAGLSNSNGYPDEGLLSLAEVVQQARYIADSVSIPAVCDADTGFGEAINVARAVKEFEGAGLAAMHIEDQEIPKKCGHLEGKRLVPQRAMEDKVRAAAKAKQDPAFLIFARTDARGVNGFDDAVRRSKAYARAGADGIFPEALESAEEFTRFAKIMTEEFGQRRPYLIANMTEFGKTPFMSLLEFEEAGYDLVIFPMTCFRAMMKTAQETLRTLKEEGTQKDMLGRMMTRNEIYDLLRYDAYRKLDREIATAGG